MMLSEKGLRLIIMGLGMASGAAAPVRPCTHRLAALPALFSAKTCKYSRTSMAREPLGP